MMSEQEIAENVKLNAAGEAKAKKIGYKGLSIGTFIHGYLHGHKDRKEEFNWDSLVLYLQDHPEVKVGDNLLDKCMEMLKSRDKALSDREEYLSNFMKADGEISNLRRAIAIVCNSIPPAKRDQLFWLHAEEFHNLIK
jgi:hypothetical protein